jgi:uncharacterized membrane protein YdjX (TVP38/TMEM64 family)
MAVRPQTLKFVGLLVLIAASLLTFQITDLGRYIKPQEIRTAIQSAGSIGPLLYLLIYSIAPTFFFPSWVLSVAGGLAFGPVWGTLLTLIGATIGATLAFFVARYLGRDFVARLLKGRFKMLDDKLAARGFQVIFFLRLIPLVPFDVLDYIGGLSKISVRDYVLGTFLGIIPGTFAYVYLGHSLTDIYSWQFAVAVGFLVLLALIPVLYKRWKNGVRSRFI